MCIRDRDVTVPKFLTAMKQLGFADVVEVAVGADICTIEAVSYTHLISLLSRIASAMATAMPSPA